MDINGFKQTWSAKHSIFWLLFHNTLSSISNFARRFDGDSAFVKKVENRQRMLVPKVSVSCDEKDLIFALFFFFLQRTREFETQE